MRSRRYAGLWIAVPLLLAAGAALGQTPVYKWVDQGGHVHYSAVPPSASLAPTGIVNTANEPPAAATTPTASTLQAADQALLSAKPGDTPECQTARATLSRYLSANYLYTLGKDGAKQKLSKEQTAQALADARTSVTNTCSAAGRKP
ncbi:MAG: DUF4124 domain-containing protein [Gammaproteobacteria bacterium]